MTSIPAPWSASDSRSFAYESTVSRWPTILAGVIDNLSQAIHPLRPDSEEDAERISEAKALISRIGELKFEISRDRELKSIPDDGGTNISIYNEELQKLYDQGTNSWFTGPWLYNEAYMYRLLRCFFAQTKTWQNYDPFAKQKTDTLRSSGASVYRLASALESIIKTDATDIESLKATFLTLAHGSLWGNATDLSLLTNLTHEQIQKLQETREDEKEKILQNDLHNAWEHVKNLKDSTIDLILDNAGFELYTDLVWMDWLVTCTPFVSRVIIHPKTVPWFVSDVLPQDFNALFDSLESDEFFPENPQESRQHLLTMVARWRKHLESGAWKLSVPYDSPLGLAVPPNQEQGIKFDYAAPSSWWTNPLPFWQIVDRSSTDKEANSILEHFKQSGLTIWKGDLNYRRLTGDLRWSTTTPFKEAICSLAGQFPILALRTCKADVVVGLADGKAEQLDATDSKWRISGHYAVVPFCPKA